ncbi:MAG: N-acetylglucosamine-6-phosphate deacetylase [Candidatus Cyclobacteriaceae bacterium M3_2C_046]
MQLFDLQVNGYCGVDFSSQDLNTDLLTQALEKLTKAGIDLFLPTIISCSGKIYQRNLEMIADCILNHPLGNHMPGIHLEGPFLSPQSGYRGAHQAKWLKPPDPSFLHQLWQWSGGTIKLITLAAELPGAAELCQTALDLGIKVSLGHQKANALHIQSLVNAGATGFTHFGNGLPHQIHRFENPLWTALASDDLWVMIIADGFHLPPEMIQAVIKAKGTQKVIIVSDASPVAGLPPGTYHTLGNPVILQENGYLYNPHTGFMVGSSAHLSGCMQYLESLEFLSPAEIQMMVFENPLKFLDLKQN